MAEHVFGADIEGHDVWRPVKCRPPEPGELAHLFVAAVRAIEYDAVENVPGDFCLEVVLELVRNPASQVGADPFDIVFRIIYRVPGGILGRRRLAVVKVSLLAKVPLSVEAVRISGEIRIPETVWIVI